MAVATLMSELAALRAREKDLSAENRALQVCDAYTYGGVYGGMAYRVYVHFYIHLTKKVCIRSNWGRPIQ